MKAWLAGVALLACAAPAFSRGATRADCDAPTDATLLRPAVDTTREARAYWLDEDTLVWPGVPAEGTFQFEEADAPLAIDTAPLDPKVAERFRFVGEGVRLKLPKAQVPDALIGNLPVTRYVGTRPVDGTYLQPAGAIDAIYADEAEKARLGFVDGRVSVWAPTANHAWVCTYAAPTSPSTGLSDMVRDDRSGVWSARVPAGAYYLYLVDVTLPGGEFIRQRVTDPYSVALSADGKRSLAISLDDPRLAVPGFEKTPDRIGASTDLSIYELHVRDFSRDDATVPAEHRGKYLGFTHAGSNGMRHLRALADAGLTDVHLLPVFDFANVPERGCDPNGHKQHDCFNWGYEPFHFNAPEGSYATEPDGIARIVEFRRMVKALHDADLRVGMDVVYNHTTAAGQSANSVLDRIVPGYYYRLDAKGEVETSTCCANTATEHRMMAKLMRDSVVQWATQFGIDSFRFDLMGHQPRPVMERLKGALWEATGRDIPLIGEGWNFGEVADGKRFVQASQLSLEGAGIGTFSDRARDAVRGGGPSDKLPALRDAKGWVNGANDAHLADLVRVGLGGTLKDPWAKVDYNGQPAGYAAQPGEVVNYVENHDNLTLFDLNEYKLPRDTSMDERARVQLLAAATTAFSQGVAYWHAGLDVLRSKSLDGNSYDSGDKVNRLDWTYTDNGLGAGAKDIAWMRDAFRDQLRIRASSSLFRMRRADDVRQRLTFPSTGDARVIAGRIDGRGFPDANFNGVLYLLNADTQAHSVDVPEARDQAWSLHPVQRTGTDARAREATFDAGTGRFIVPARTAVVFVLPPSPEALPPLQTTRVPAGFAGSDAIRVDVQLPPHYDDNAQARYPVLYLNDGQDLQDVRVRDTLQAAYEAGTLRPMILVAMHMPKDRMGAYGLSDRATDRSVIAPTKYGPVGTHAHAYSQWVAQTLVPWVDARHRTLADAKHRTVLGWSLGGLNAFDLGWNYPEVFGNVGAFSPSFWLSADPTDDATTERTRLAQDIVLSNPKHAPLHAYFAAGTAEEASDRDHDGTIDVIDDAQDLAAALRSQGGDVTVVRQQDGIHRQPTWAAMLPAFLRWAYPGE